MAKKALRIKAEKKPKYMSRTIRRCQRCGRPRSITRYFSLCRLCFRELAVKGHLPGVTKSSW